MEDLATAQAMTPPEDLKSKIWSKIQEKEQITEEKISDVSQPSMNLGIEEKEK